MFDSSPTALNSGKRPPAKSGASRWSIDDFCQHQLSSMLIRKASSRFRKPLNLKFSARLLCRDCRSINLAQGPVLIGSGQGRAARRGSTAISAFRNPMGGKKFQAMPQLPSTLDADRHGSSRKQSLVAATAPPLRCDRRLRVVILRTQSVSRVQGCWSFRHGRTLPLLACAKLGAIAGSLQIIAISPQRLSSRRGDGIFRLRRALPR